MNEKFHLPATTALCGAWVWALISERVVDDPRIGISVLLVLGAATLAAVRHVHVRRIEIGTIAKVLCVITTALMMFTFWGALLTSLSMPTLPASLPKGVRLAPLFFIGPVAAAITAVVFVYPLAVLLPRVHWLVPVLAAVLVVLLQYEFMVDPAERLLTRTLMTLELGSVAILVPVIVEPIARRTLQRMDTPSVLGGMD